MHYSEICRNKAEKRRASSCWLISSPVCFYASTNPSIDYLNLHLSNSSYASDAEGCITPVLSYLGFLCAEL